MRFHIQLLAQPSMLSLDEKLRELDDLPVDISTHFHTAKHNSFIALRSGLTLFNSNITISCSHSFSTENVI